MNTTPTGLSNQPNNRQDPSRNASLGESIRMRWHRITKDFLWLIDKARGVLPIALVLVVLLFCALVIWVAPNIGLRRVRLPDDLWALVPVRGQQQVVAQRDLEAGRQLVRTDLDTVWSFYRPDVFTDPQRLVNAYTAEAISAGQPILHTQIKRYQVVAKQDLMDMDQRITADHLDLALTPYRAQAYTDKAQVVGQYPRQTITRGLTILDSVIDHKYVVAKWELEANHFIADTDLDLTFWGGNEDDYFTDVTQISGLSTKEHITAGTPVREGQVSLVQVFSESRLDAGHLIITTTGLITKPLDHYTNTIFTKPGLLLDHYTLTRVEANNPILKNQVALCQAIAAQAMPAYHLIKADDLKVDKKCEPITDRITGKWVERYTCKPIKPGTVIQDADLVPKGDGISADNTVAIPFTVPSTAAFGGNLKAGDVVTIFLVERSETVTQTSVLTITECLLLAVEEIAPGQTAKGQAAGGEAPPAEPKTLIVAAIPKADESEFIRRLPFSEAVLSVATK